MTGRDQEPLTPEERDLARRLARTGAPAEPSPALDARILAAARAATGATAVDVRKAPARRRPRFAWATGLGVAASLLLAVGIAWQLRPLPDADVQYSEAPAAAPAGDEPLAELRTPDAFPAPPAEPPAPAALPKPMSPTTAATAPGEEPQRARRQSMPARDAAEQAVTQAAEAPVVFDDPSPVDASAPRQAAPAPPPQAASASQPDLSALSPAGAAAAGAPRESANERERKASAAEAGHDATMQRRDGALDRIEVTGSRIREEEDAEAGYADQPYDDDPPASADSPEVRKAWLARIRELLDEGKVDAARTSLAEFHRRHPEAPLPDDLRPLLE